jgi:hypothetical protein
MPPVIDIHAHVFRGRDIPLKGYLLSRSYPEWYIRLLAPLLFAIIARCIRRGRAVKGGILCGLVLELVYKYMGLGYRRWAEILSMETVAEVARRLVETFDQDGIDLYVPLMIDYEYWFKATGETPIAAQIDAVYREIVLPYKGRIHPFAPFDPARELAYRARLPGPTEPEDGPPEEYSSLELAKDAVRNKGFIGVKVYNTLGYRPLDNAVVDDNRQRIFRRNGMERYAVFTGAQLDQVLSELYTFCVQEQVPITAHCLANGIEAYPGASLDFGSPVYWRKVLDNFPDLHLNLAHFGWSRPEEYFPPVLKGLLALVLHRLQRVLGSQSAAAPPGPGPAEGQGAWVREICAMLAQYRYLFTDVAHHGVTADADIPKYKAAYQAMRRDFPGAIEGKLLFGIDWHVIARVDNYQYFKDRYTHVWGDDNLFTPQEIAAFLGGNALQFLGLLPLGTPPADGWMRNRARLQRFYQRNQIDPPEWFKATA